MQKFRAKSFSPLGYYYMDRTYTCYKSSLTVCIIICSQWHLGKLQNIFFCILLLEKKDYAMTQFSPLAKKIFDFPLPIWISIGCIQISSSSMARETGQCIFQKEQSTKERRYFILLSPFLHSPHSPTCFFPLREPTLELNVLKSFINL